MMVSDMSLPVAMTPGFARPWFIIFTCSAVVLNVTSVTVLGLATFPLEIFGGSLKNGMTRMAIQW